MFSFTRFSHNLLRIEVTELGSNQGTTFSAMLEAFLEPPEALIWALFSYTYPQDRFEHAAFLGVFGGPVDLVQFISADCLTDLRSASCSLLKCLQG